MSNQVVSGYTSQSYFSAARSTRWEGGAKQSGVLKMQRHCTQPHNRHGSLSASLRGNLEIVRVRSAYFKVSACLGRPMAIGLIHGGSTTNPTWMIRTR